MRIKANLLRNVLKGSSKLTTKIEKKPTSTTQLEELKKLLHSAKFTSFGKHYQFKQILKSDNVLDSYQQTIPIHDYDNMYDNWWFRTHTGEKDVTWPGVIDRFALSSGTSGSTSKYIPVSKHMIQKINRVNLRLMQHLSEFDLSLDFFESAILGVGGSTSLNVIGNRAEGDLSGIINANMPAVFYPIYKPEKEITAINDWNTKIERMVEKAPEWNIGLIVGIPSWIQILIEKIIERYELNNIHELWPNLRVLVHGGVAFGPYKHNFEKLLSRPINYMETYLTSEGFLGYSNGFENPIKLVQNRGIFFEFIPFTDSNFDAEGVLRKNPEVYSLEKITEEVDYAIIISTCSGTWRYLLGDTVRFLNAARAEIIITGRIKHYLTICGEHLSVDNMNQALQRTCERMNITVPEYCVKAYAFENLFAHKWYIGSDDNFDKAQFKIILDANLSKLNDDYKTERTAALKEIFIEQLPVNTFYDFLTEIGKEGAQIKFPRVMKGKMSNNWSHFIKNIKEKI